VPRIYHLFFPGSSFRGSSWVYSFKMKKTNLENIIYFDFKHNSKSKRVNSNLFMIPIIGSYYAYRDMKQCGLTYGERIFGTALITLYQSPIIALAYGLTQRTLEHLNI